MVDANVFIVTMIIAITQMIKMAAPKIAGWATIIIAILVGLVVSILAAPLGVAQVSIAQGIIDGLTAIGVTVLASKAGGGASGD